MSITMTIVESGRNLPQQQLQSSAVVALAAEENIYNSHAQRLFEILVTHEHLRDPLSYEMFNIGKDLMEYVCNKEQQPTLEGLTEHFNLLKNLLLNPFGPHMLENPVYVNNIVQERYFAEFRNRCQAARGLPQDHIEQHDFAAQVIQWIHCIESFFSLSQDRAQSPANRIDEVAAMIIRRDPLKDFFERVNMDSEDEVINCLNFFTACEVKFLNKRKENFETRIQLRESRKIIAVQQHHIALAHAKRDREVQEFKEDCQRHKAEVVNNLNDIRNDYQRSLVEVKKEVLELKKDLSVTNEKLVDAEAGNKSRDSTITHLYNQLHHAHQRISEAQNSRPRRNCVIS